MGSGFGHVYPASHPPMHAHCIVEVAGLWDNHNRLSVGTDGGSFGRGHKKQPR